MGVSAREMAARAQAVQEPRELNLKKKIFFLTFIHFLRVRERQSMSGGGAEREGDTESEAGSRL